MECVGVEMSGATTSPPAEQLTVRLKKSFRGDSGLPVHARRRAGGGGRLHHSVRGLRGGEDHAARLHCRAANARRGRDCDRRRRPLRLAVARESAAAPPLRRLPAAIAGAISAHDGRAECAVRTGRAQAARSRRAQRRGVGIVPHFFSVAAASQRNFCRRTPAGCAGARAGDASARAAAGRTAHRAGRGHQSANPRRSARLEPAASHSHSLRYARPRRSLRAGRKRDCAGGRPHPGAGLAARSLAPAAIGNRGAACRLREHLRGLGDRLASASRGP